MLRALASYQPDLTGLRLWLGIFDARGNCGAKTSISTVKNRLFKQDQQRRKTFRLPNHPGFGGGGMGSRDGNIYPNRASSTCEAIGAQTPGSDAPSLAFWWCTTVCYELATDHATKSVLRILRFECALEHPRGKGVFSLPRRLRSYP